MEARYTHKHTHIHTMKKLKASKARHEQTKQFHGKDHAWTTKSRCLGFSFETLVASVQPRLKHPHNLPHLESLGALRIMSGRNICSRALPRCSRECRATAASCLLRMSILLRSRRPQTTTKGRIQRIAGEQASMRAHIAEIRMRSHAADTQPEERGERPLSITSLQHQGLGFRV